jgi:hypothetical protein
LFSLIHRRFCYWSFVHMNLLLVRVFLFLTFVVCCFCKFLQHEAIEDNFVGIFHSRHSTCAWMFHFLPWKQFNVLNVWISILFSKEQNMVLQYDQFHDFTSI